MKVFICKFFNELKIEDRVSWLVSREKKRTGGNPRVLCVDEQTQKRLEVAGIASEVLPGFWQGIDADNESHYNKAYQVSDRLHSSTENDNSLKYHGINFLTLEYDLSLYVRAAQLS